MRTSLKDSIIICIVLVMIIHGCTKHSSQRSQTIRYGGMKLIPGGTFEMVFNYKITSNLLKEKKRLK